MTERGNRYALAALKEKRMRIAGEIVQLQRQLQHKREQLTHLDETLRLFDPSIDPDTIRPRKRYINLFKQGELSRIVMDQFRRAKGKPLTTTEVVAGVIEAMGHDEKEAWPAFYNRVLGSLYYQRRRGRIESTRKGDDVCVWRLANH